MITIDIFLSINNREQVIKLPVVPSEFSIQSPQNNNTFTTISQGDIKLIGNRGLKSIRISSFFPAQNYDFNKDNTYKSWEYVEIIEKWISRRIPIRLIITQTPINMAVSIENFEYSERDGSRDVYFTLELEEFKFIQLQSQAVS